MYRCAPPLPSPWQYFHQQQGVLKQFYQHSSLNSSTFGRNTLYTRLPSLPLPWQQSMVNSIRQLNSFRCKTKVRTSTTGAETLRGTVETASYTYATLAFQPPTVSSSTTHPSCMHVSSCMCVCMFMYVCVLPRLSRPKAGSLHYASRLIISHYSPSLSSPSLSSPSLSVPHRLTLYLACVCVLVSVVVLLYIPVSFST